MAIINDTIYEGDEDFFLDLSIAPEFQIVGINEGSLLRATVTIEDDDGEINALQCLNLPTTTDGCFRSRIAIDSV